jgi:hypothetical protein
VNEPLGSRPVRLGCYPLGSLDVNGMKGLLSALDVKTDRIYDAYPTILCQPLVETAGYLKALRLSW